MVDEHSSFPSAHFLLVLAGWEMRTAAEVGAKKMLSGKEKKKLKDRERKKILHRLHLCGFFKLLHPFLSSKHTHTHEKGSAIIIFKKFTVPYFQTKLSFFRRSIWTSHSFKK